MSATLAERQEILQDYYICCLSRELSLVIRRDVLTGRAKFGVSDDGKEVFQVAMAKAYQNGDWRADYYRGHTLLLALDLAKPEDILAQLYADPNNDPDGAPSSNSYTDTAITITDDAEAAEEEERLRAEEEDAVAQARVLNTLLEAYALLLEVANP